MSAKNKHTQQDKLEQLTRVLSMSVCRALAQRGGLQLTVKNKPRKYLKKQAIPQQQQYQIVGYWAGGKRWGD